MSEPIIHTRGLTRSFGEIRALDGLDLDVPPGIVFGFLGPNGAGKTTAIRLLLGLLEPTCGSARVLGFDTRSGADAIRCRSGALLEHHGLYERLSAQDNLDFYARAWHLDRANRASRIRELLEPLGLWDRRHEPVGGWSRGMKQKLAVARALLHRPKLLFLDEPSAGLDPVAATALREDLSGLVSREGVTVFLTTHNLGEAERLCQRVAVIKQGRLLAVGHPDELRSRHSLRAEITGRGFDDRLLAALRDRSDVVRFELRNGRLLIDLRHGAELSPLVSMMVHAGAEVEEARKDRNTLEDVFLTLVEEDR
ncbi:MAG: ABC transporter ATP-binding protein [Acidobacteriota bacterium]